MPRSALLLALALLSAAGAQRPIETATFLTGAWGQPWDDASRELYLKAGFNLIGYSGTNADWAVQNGLKFISSVGSWGLPSEVNRPFEAHDGTRSGTVGLFTSINFNAPSVEEWWQQSVPKQVASQKHADQVAFWKVHNEFGYHAAKVWDYSPGSIARYQRWLGERYPSLAELNRRWGTQYAAYGAIQPPRALPTSELANWLEWRRFTCWNFGDYFRTTGDLIRRSVPGAAVSDNLYPVNPMEGWDMFDLARQTDYVAFDIYSIGRWDGLISSLDKGRSAAAAWSKPFVMMEYHAGPNNWIHEVLAKDLYIEANLGLAREMRALQWYMWRPGGGGREQGIHGMLDSQGRPTERYTAARDVSEKTARLAPLLQRSRLQPPVAIVVSSDNSYLAYGQRGDHWAPLRLWENLGRLLDDARIPHEAIDPTWLAANDPSRYRAIIVANVALLGEQHLARLRDYAAGGGTVIFQPDSGRYDDLGQRRAAPLFDSAATEGPVFAKRLLGGQEMVVETVGQGRIVKLSWELPSRLGDGDLRRQRSQAYAKLLAEQAGIQPAIRIDGETEPWKLDAMLLTTPEADLLYLTALSHEPREKVEVSLGRVQPATTGYLLRPGSSAVARLPLRQEGGATRLTIPRLDPAVVVVLPRAWQPLVGIESPARLVAGGRYAVAVTVDNLGAESVGGAVALTLPAGWTATPATGRVDNLAPGNRASVPFEISVPAEAALDRFAIDYPLTARVTFDRGRSGALSATALPFLVPAIDLAATYQGKLLNPWQEMAPAIMRWGWDSEVRIPPPPPVAIGAAAPVTLTITADPSLRGQTAQLRIEPAGSISPTSVALTGGMQTVAATLRLAQPGPVSIVAQAGEQRFAAAFEAGVNTETVEACLTGDSPALYRLGVGARQAAVRRSPVTFAVKLTPAEATRAVVVDEAGQPVPAAVGPSRVTLAASVPRDQARVYRVVAAGAAAPPAVASRAGEEGELVVGSDRYQVAFDTLLGLVKRLEDGTGRVIAPYRTGVVVQPAGGGAAWAPDARAGVNSLATAVSPVSARVEFSRPLGPQRQLEVTERWSLEAERIAVEVEVKNVAPASVALDRIDYELGFDPQVLTAWRIVGLAGTERGAMPSGFGAQSPSLLVDFVDQAGVGMGLTLGRCAVATKWQNGFLGTRHSPAGTAIGLLAGLRLDPADYLLAEFELWPHGATPLQYGDAEVPELVTVARPGK